MSVDEFERQLEAISAEYRRELPARLERVDRLWRDLASRGTGTKRITELLRELHSIAGTARTFGVAGVSEAATEAESFLEPFASQGKLPPAARRAEFDRLLGSLKKAAA